MKLIYQIILRLSVVLTVVLTVWGMFFYVTIMDEVNDETDDSLEDYSEDIITRALAGQALPSRSDGSNNSYFLTEVTAEYASEITHIRYSDEDVYVVAKEETEPARVLRTIYKDRDGRFFELTVSIPSIEKEDLRAAILNWVVILYFALLVVVILINVWIFQRSMRPLYSLLRWLDQYTLGEKSGLPELKTRITEFRKLYAAAERNVERNQAIYEQQKQFIGNASHELQTPLAICQNRLEMLAEAETLGEAELAEVTKVQETLGYIIRLNKSLLLLSKIENGQFQENKRMALNAIVKKQVEDYQDIYGYKGIRLDVEEQGELEVCMSETLATILITNLLKNAYTHNVAGGRIEVSVAAHRLTVRNTGAQGALDEKRVFERFYQGGGSGQGSSGLGLAIAEAICKMYGIEIRYFYTDMHCFELRFP